ncbi:type II toxin-antitoxin system VapC family toxin [Sphingomonas sp. A2-49]|uniref:type II toxin-antitoxin system VapC family toxin n=1 Tax=Sphingomonas sp. A2-49 TaxID=1391375 RepID=UPI0021CE711E|nr:type II toxin-antitoxin system VapC family toxin [Sphingomonas sp. A2-49]MCU6453489.1 type II toxin-antitoxin system VapC family toxin [Sphingomonas sp. A2-49]
MIFVDTNVIIDVLQDDPDWRSWSLERLGDARADGELLIDVIVIAELSRDYPTLMALHGAIAPLELTLSPLNAAAAFEAGHRFLTARAERGGGEAKRPLADFFIGAHALTAGASLLTRDTRIYRRYFPDLPLITPETHS